MRSTLLLLLILVLFACKNDPDPTPADIVTYSDVRSFTGNENWIIAWNSKGELLDYKKFAPDEVVTLKSTGDISDNKITIGFLNYSNSDDYKSHDISIFTDIAPGQTFAFAYPTSNNQNIDDTKKFTVNVPSTGIYRFLQISDASGYSEGGGSGTEDFQLECTIASAGEYNVMYRTDDNLRHKILSDVKAGDVINLTEDDFTPYEHQVTYTYPPGQVDLIINAYTPDIPITSGGVVLDFYLGGKTSTSITTGYYGNSFNSFTTTFDHSSNSGHTFVQFTKLGSLPTEMKIPESVSFPVTNKDPFNMAISSPSNALFHEMRWGNQLYQADGIKTSGYVQWTVIGPSDQVKIGALPDEILAAYPLLKIDASHYMHSRVFLGPQTYNEYVSMNLNNKRWDEYEQTSVMSR